jgi:hypothetical protein
MNKTRLFIVWISILGLAQSCNNCNNDAVKDIQVQVEWHRFDSLIYNINQADQLLSGLQTLETEDSLFYWLYFNKMYSFNSQDENYHKLVFQHINSAQNQAIKKRIDTMFGDFSEVYKEVELLAKYYKLRYPKQEFPTIHTCYSGIAGFMAWHYGENDMLLDLDMYLGSDFEAYPQFFPKYKFTYYDKDNIPQNIAKELIRKQYLEIEQSKPKNMLEMMLIEASKIHDVKNLMPCKEVYKIMEYSADQWEWLSREEAYIWKYFLKEDLLFESDYNEYRPLIGEAPESKRSGVAPGAPPRIAIYAGYRIIERALKEQKISNAKELLLNFSPQEILEIAKYKP